MNLVELIILGVIVVGSLLYIIYQVIRPFTIKGGCNVCSGCLSAGSCQKKWQIK